MGATESDTPWEVGLMVRNHTLTDLSVFHALYQPDVFFNQLTKSFEIIENKLGCANVKLLVQLELLDFIRFQ